jgi:hypothetical protein
MQYEWHCHMTHSYIKVTITNYQVIPQEDVIEPPRSIVEEPRRSVQPPRIRAQGTTIVQQVSLVVVSRCGCLQWLQ